MTDYATNTPWGCDALTGTRSFEVTSERKENNHGPFPCFTQWKTLADTVDKKGVTWKYYAPQTVGCPVRCDNGGLEWSAFDAISAVRNGPDWQYNVIFPQTTVLDDAKNGDLAAVSWAIPDHKNSDHPDSKSNTGPSWVASVVNAIGQSQYWNSSAIVVVILRLGRLVPLCPPPQLDFLGLDTRRLHYHFAVCEEQVIHTPYESGSILKFVEHTFGVTSLGYSDARANSIADSFDFNRAPRVFTPIPSAYKAWYFLHQHPSREAPDDQGRESAMQKHSYDARGSIVIYRLFRRRAGGQMLAPGLVKPRISMLMPLLRKNREKSPTSYSSFRKTGASIIFLQRSPGPTVRQPASDTTEGDSARGTFARLAGRLARLEELYDRLRRRGNGRF